MEYKRCSFGVVTGEVFNANWSGVAVKKMPMTSYHMANCNWYSSSHYQKPERKRPKLSIERSVTLLQPLFTVPFIRWVSSLSPAQISLLSCNIIRVEFVEATTIFSQDIYIFATLGTQRLTFSVGEGLTDWEERLCWCWRHRELDLIDFDTILKIKTRREETKKMRDFIIEFNSHVMYEKNISYTWISREKKKLYRKKINRETKR